MAGYPTPKVDWLRLDGKIPLGRTTVTSENTLILSQVSASDSGHYACIAENDAGLIRTEVYISVLALPYFKERPGDQILKIGTTFKLPCSIDGEPTPISMWRLPGDDPGGMVISNEENGHQRIDENGSLVLENLQLSDSGIYTCMGTNTGGGVIARSKVLTVESFPPPIIGIFPEDQVIYRISTLTLPCVPDSEISDPDVSWWFRPSVHLPEQKINEDIDAGIILSGNVALVIRNANRSNSGIYTCRVTTKTGTAEATAVVRYEDKFAEHQKINKFLPASPSKPRVRMINETTVRLIWQPNSSQNGKTRSVTYMIEFWRHGWTEWKIANAHVESETVIISGISPNYTYTFLVRSIINGRQSYPSPWSNPVRLDMLNKVIPSSRIRWQADRRFEKPTLALMSVSPSSPTSVLLNWQGLGEEIQEDGVLVYWINHETLPGKGQEKYPSQVHVSSVIGNSTSSYLVRGLQPYTRYTFFMVPFWKNVEGTPTNSLSITTPGDSKY